MKSRLSIILIFIALVSLNLVFVKSQVKSPKWKTCAKEGKRCKFGVGFEIVRFGANGKYSYKQQIRDFDCNIKEFGNKDPNADSKEKTCDIFESRITWVACGTEGAKCNFKGSRLVRYGSNGNYNYIPAENGAECKAELFDTTTKAAPNANCFFSEEIDPDQFSWNWCAAQGGECNINGSQIVRYGKDAIWTYVYRAGPVPCNDNLFSDPINKHDITKECQYIVANETKCPDNLILNGRHCVGKCPVKSWLTVDKKACVYKCPSPSLAVEGTGECLNTCPMTHYKKGSECLKCKPGYKQSLLINSCVLDCPANKVNVIASTLTFERDICLDACPSGYKLNQETKLCLVDCADYNYITSSDGLFCLSKCPQGQFTIGNDCYFDCPVGLYRSLDRTTCLPACSEGSKLSPDYRSCINTCPGNFFKYKSFPDCSSRCPENLFTGNDECVNTNCENRIIGNYQCNTKCPESFFFHKTTRLCHSTCPANLFVNGRECVEECPPGRNVAADRRTCEEHCPEKQFLVEARKACYFRCPALWRTNGKRCEQLI